MKRRNLFLMLFVLLLSLGFVASCKDKNEEKEPEQPKEVEVSNEVAYAAAGESVKQIVEKAGTDLKALKVNVSVNGTFKDLGKELFEGKEQAVVGSLSGAAQIGDLSKLESILAAVNGKVTFNGEEFALIELFVKNKAMAGHFKVADLDKAGQFNDEYTYNTAEKGEGEGEGEGEEEPDLAAILEQYKSMITAEQIDAVVAALKEALPTPKTTQTGATTSIVFTVTMDNILDYITAVAGLVGGETPDEADFAEMLSAFNINKLELRLDITGTESIKISADFDVKVMTYVAKGSLSIELSTKDVTVSVSDDKMAAIKAAYDAQIAAEEEGEK